MSAPEDDPHIEYERLPEGEHLGTRLGRPVLDLIESLRSQLPEGLGRSWVAFFKDADNVKYEIDLGDLNLELGDTDGTFRAEIYGTIEETVAKDTTENPGENIPEKASRRRKVLVFSGGALAIGTVLGLVYYSQVRSHKDK